MDASSSAPPMLADELFRGLLYDLAGELCELAAERCGWRVVPGRMTRIARRNRFGHYVRGVDDIVALHVPIRETIYRDSPA